MFFLLSNLLFPAEVLHNISHFLWICESEGVEAARFVVNRFIEVNRFHQDSNHGTFWHIYIGTWQTNAFWVYDLNLSTAGPIEKQGSGTLTVRGRPTIANGLSRIDSRIIESISFKSRTASRVHDPPALARTPVASSRKVSTYPSDGSEL